MLSKPTPRFTLPWLVLAIFTGGQTVSADSGADAVTVIRDLAYTSGKTTYEKERCRLDLYLPEGKTEFPVVVWIHGGGLTGGDKGKSEATDVGMRLAAEGIAVAIPNYRLFPKIDYPTYTEDVASAFAWVKAHISSHGGNADEVILGGHSAGGYLTVMVALNPRYLEPHGLTPMDIAGIIPVSGQMYVHTAILKERGLPPDSMIIDEAANLYYADNPLPPALFICGGEDMAGRCDQSRDMVRELLANGNQNIVFKEVPGRTHMTVVTDISEPDDTVAYLIVSFVRELAQYK